MVCWTEQCVGLFVYTEPVCNRGRGSVSCGSVVDRFHCSYFKGLKLRLLPIYGAYDGMYLV